MQKLRPLSAAVLLLATFGAHALAACSDDDTVAALASDGGGVDATSESDASQADTGTAGDGSPGTDSASDAGSVDRGPTAIAFDGTPNGIYWDYGKDQALYVADEAHDTIVKWTDTGGFSTYAHMPTWDAAAYDAASGPPGLGQVVRTLDGTTIVTRFGFGSVGGVIVVDPLGDASVVPNLSVSKRRVGLAILADGTLVDSYFSKAPDGGGGPADSGRAGAVARLSVTAGTEKDMVTGLAKPVGVVHNEGKLVVSDQDFGLLIKTPDGGFFTTDDAGPPDASADAAPPPASFTQLAALASPDAIAKGPDGSVFVAGPGVVYQVSRAGAVTTVATGLGTVHGVSFDGAHTRLFVSEVTASGGNLRIYPVN